MNPIKSANYLYIVRCDDAYKIGVSSLPEQRIALIKTDNYRPVSTICIVELTNAYKVEANLHEVFKESGNHIRGEWYSVASAMLSEDFTQDFLEMVISMDKELGLTS